MKQPIIQRASFGLFVILFFTSNLVNAYEVVTHGNITQAAVSQAANYTAFIRDCQLNSGLAINSIMNGSIHEDDGFLLLCRCKYHFYDPTNGRGLNTFLLTAESSLNWGFNGGAALQGNEFSWTEAREYMYNALTATTPEQRNENFQLMFRSVGQIMHLVQDLASPAHVRNDLHLPVGLAGDLYEHYTFDKYDIAWTTGYPTVKLSRFSDFWNFPKGLAVFTNRNFISQGTNFDNFNSSGQLFYDSPQIGHITTKTEFIRNQFGVTVPVEVDYIGNSYQDSYTGETITNDRLTAFSVFDFEAQEILNERVYSVNDFTMESAANILVRHAVGYSAGLLDYFFRGRIDMVKDPNTTGQYLIQNKTAEPMSGTFSLYYDDIGNNRLLVASWSNVTVSPNGQSSSVTFKAPTSPQPKEKGKYILVFQGSMGNEEGTIVGTLVKVNSDPPLYVQFIIWDEPFTIPNRTVYWDIEHDVEVNLSNAELVSSVYSIRNFNDLKERTYTTSSYLTRPCGPDLPEGELVWSGPNPGMIFLQGVATPFGTREVIWKQPCSGDVRTQVFSETWSDRIFGYSFARDNALGYLGINIPAFRSTSVTQDLRSNQITATVMSGGSSQFGIYLFSGGVLNSRIESESFPFEMVRDLCFTCPTQVISESSSGTSLGFEGGGVTLDTFEPHRNWAVTVYGEHNTSQGQRCGILFKGRPDVVHVRIDSFDYTGTQLEHAGNKNLPNLGGFWVSHVDQCPSLEGLVTGELVE